MPEMIMLNGQMVPRKTFVELKKAWQQAEIDGKDIFQFQGQDVLCNYAKYVIQYAEHEFKEKL